MGVATTASLIAMGLMMLFGFGAFGLLSHREGERHAARVALGAGVLTALPLFLACLLPVAAKLIILSLIVGGGIVAVILFLLPVGQHPRGIDQHPRGIGQHPRGIDQHPRGIGQHPPGKGQIGRGTDAPWQRFDERDVVFARARLVPGSPEYEAYYAMRPENKAGDDKLRTLPGLLSPTASKADPLAFAAAEASFSLTEALREEVDGPIAPARSEFTAAQMTSYVKGLARYYGAYTVGIAELQLYHVYSHIGRGSGEYGAPITLDHRYAIAFTVEMDRMMVGFAPDAPVVMESARQYVEAARVALQLGYLIRSLGYPARAHIDGNYRIIAPLVARDAGLGEIGRIGLLMTPELGPRVRLGVVTTDLPLIPDQRDDDTSVIDFCRICKKCAENCPSRSIPLGDREEVGGALRWRINADTCFRYWNLIGTDCGRCMAVCPYSHPNNLAHNLVRRAVRHSSLARRAALWMDDVFYPQKGPRGEHKPASRPVPAWISRK